MACAIQDGLATLFQASMGCVPLARTETTETDRIFRVCGHAVRRPSRRLYPGPRSSAPSAGDVGRACRGKPSGKTLRVANRVSNCLRCHPALTASCLKARSGVVRGPCNNSVRGAYSEHHFARNHHVDNLPVHCTAINYRHWYGEFALIHV